MDQMVNVDQMMNILGSIFPCCIPPRSAAIFQAVDEAVAQSSLDVVRDEIKRYVHLIRSRTQSPRLTNAAHGKE
jgi:hypothetical protein